MCSCTDNCLKCSRAALDVLSGDYTASPLRREFAMLTSLFSHLDDCMLTIKQASE